MDLLVVAEDFYPNTSGGAHARWRFCQIAVERGHAVTVFTPKRDDRPTVETVDGVEIQRPCRAHPTSMAAYDSLAFVTRLLATVIILVSALRWVRANDVDSVHSASNTTHWIGKVVSLKFGVPLVNFVGYTPSYDAGRHRLLDPKYLLERVAFRYCMGKVVFCRSSDVRRRIEAESGSDVRVLHGVVNELRLCRVVAESNPAVVRDELAVDDDAVLLAFVGRLSPLKRPTAAVELLLSLPARYELVVVGDGPERQALDEKITSLGLRERVHILGQCEHERALAVIAAGDALVLTSRAEAYPTVVFEALSLRRTVFAPPVGILPELSYARLHLTSVEILADRIAEADLSVERGVDEGVLKKYSMTAYTDAILDAIQTRTRS